ncbi:transglutaminase domain-containing protein [Acidaminobacter sp. JC074]|uniref:transglutaminase domain-containing protein n=1 Tax=Acidaminobacter sp. JC074 TaxID=2530199 RepID=UPI001F0CF005|nr:transglutaminase domain-containing protein [Acidaminobacter sp. JC074]
MFYQRAHGSCSGTSEFYASVFQALGIPAKVMPIATTIDTGKLHDEEGSKHQSLYQLRVDQADNFSNKSVRNAWLRGLDDFGSNHVMSYVYLGNRWVNVDIAGGMNFNRQPVMGNFIVFHKTADYDFYETLQKISEQWLITDHKYFDQFVKSDNFDSKTNDVYHYYGNFSLKVFEIYDAYGSHITSEIKRLADKAETNERDMLNMGRELRLNSDDEVYYAFDNRDNFDLVLDKYYPNVNLSFFGIYNHLQENPEKFIHENAHLMISTGISYNDLPDVLRNRVSSEAYQTLISGVTTYEISGAFVHFLKP